MRWLRTRLAFIIIAAVMWWLCGCRSYYAYYGHEGFTGWMTEMGCIREFGDSCAEADLDQHYRLRAAIRQGTKN